MHFKGSIFFVVSLFVLLLTSCKQSKVPDVSKIDVPLTVLRFDKDFFSLDSSNLATRLDSVIAKYPSFGEVFLSRVLNVNPNWSADTAAIYIRQFLAAYKPVYDSSQKLFADFAPWQQELKKALQYCKYYFPDYAVPSKVVTYIGPMDGYGDILDAEALIVGLHHHLGSNFSLYASNWVRETYPDYISARFTPEYIPINAMVNVVGDLYPDKSEDKSLVIQMVEKGKRLYLLQKLLPHTQPHLLIGYTEKQWNACVEKQVVIWDLFIQNNLLRTLEYNLIKNYVGEGPKTQELGEGAPGNIGSFVGWQIVNKYMEKFSETSLPQLMALDAEQLFQQAKYKP